MNVADAVRQRKSIRAFRPDPIAIEDLRDLLTTAQRSPSGCNLQPWKIIAVAGDARASVLAMAQEAIRAGDAFQRPIDPPFVPDFEANDPVYFQRFQRMGELTTGAAGVQRDDRESRMALTMRNFEFFGAPVGLFIVVNRTMGEAQWGHTGMYLQTIALLAVERGWGTCMQEAWGMLRPELHAHLGLKENELVWCAMAIGHPDLSAPVNQFTSERAPLDEIVDFRGF